MTARRPSRRLAAAWLRELGVDWYLPSPAAPRAEAPPARSVGKGVPAVGPSPRREPESSAGAATLDAIRAEALACRACPLRDGATQVVFGTGSAKARLLFIGEGPGEEEDRQGEPFVGKAGKLLDRWIARLGLARADVYIANVVKCRPPGNRAPEPAEAAACIHWLHDQLRLVRPEVVCTLGGTALKHLLGVQEGITRVRGKWLDFDGIPVLPTYHPAYILRNPRAEADVFVDMASLVSRLGAG